jgi:pyridoxal phosphate enzyme (YggS family)
MLDQALIEHWHTIIQNRLTDATVGLCYPQDAKWLGVTLVAVTKYATAEQMVGAFNAGLTHFGESRPVEALQKRATLPTTVEQSVTWHFIGHLQKNKINKVVGYYQLIHSVDSFELLTAINQRASTLTIIQDVLIQVNISGEHSKQGIALNAVEDLIKKAENLSSIRVLGLMTMAPKEASPTEQAHIFGTLQTRLQRWQQNIKKELTISSMGMTQDYSQALLKGATIVRIGNKLFT